MNPSKEPGTNSWVNPRDLFSLSLALALFLGNTFLMSGLLVNAVGKPSLLTGLTLSAGFALLAFWFRTVDLGGAIAGGLIATCWYSQLDWPGFLLLVGSFGLVTIATLAGKYGKQQADGRKAHGKRSSTQIVANLFFPTLLVITPVWRLTLFDGSNGIHIETWILGWLSGLAAAVCDTVASEVGQRYGKSAHMITSFEPASPGTDGAISLVGTIAAGVVACLYASLLFGLLAVFASRGDLSSLLVPFLYFLIAAGCAFSGMLFDSVLGATVQRRGWVSNETVNLLATTFAASSAMVLACWLRLPSMIGIPADF